MRRASATGRKLRALHLAFLDIAFDTVALPAHRERTHVGGRIERVADLDQLEISAQCVDHAHHAGRE